jgi:DcmR-like sensory protein
MANLSHITHCGLPGIEWIPFGMHACHFYSSTDQLVAALVPFAVAGLCSNERCLWVTAPLLPAREAVQALRAACDDVDDAIQAGAPRILDSARLKGLDVVQLWLDEEEERALAEGYNGLRIAGDTRFLTFMEDEHAVTARCNGRRIVTLCSGALAQCNDQQMSEVMHAHHCALERLDTYWQVFAVPSSWGFESRWYLIEMGVESKGDSHD